MPDALGPASEFGGKVQKNRVQPPPHVPSPSERLMLLYTTGDESGRSNPDPNSDIMMGLLPEDEQRAIRKAEGVLDVGQEWERIKQEADQALGEIPAKDAGGEIVG